MSKHPVRIEDYVGHMIDAIDRIRTYTENKSQQDFERDTLCQDAVLRNLGVLGEAAKRVLNEAPSALEANSGIPFARIYGLRNQIEHGYDTVDMEIVWKVVVKEIPSLRPKLEALLRNLPSTDPGQLPLSR